MYEPDSPTDLPSYEYSVAEKTRGQRLPPREIVDEQGWLIYDAGAFEAAANEASSSAAASVSVAGRPSSSLRSRPSIMKVRMFGNAGIIVALILS